jgi:spermidine/putrescine transport system permease protein
MDRSLTEASFDLFASPLRTAIQVTLPQLWPAIITGALLAFTFSFDDYIIASFVAGPGQPTLPMYVFASIRRGITPEINAIASLVLGVTVTALVIVGVVYRRQARQTRIADVIQPLATSVGVLVAEEAP